MTTITDADRVAALACLMAREDFGKKFQEDMLAGNRDSSNTVQAFAAHREAATSTPAMAAVLAVHGEARFQAGVLAGREAMRDEAVRAAERLGQPVGGSDGSTRYVGTSDQAATAIRAIPLEPEL